MSNISINLYILIEQSKNGFREIKKVTPFTTFEEVKTNLNELLLNELQQLSETEEPENRGIFQDYLQIEIERLNTFTDIIDHEWFIQWTIWKRTIEGDSV